MKLSLLKRWKTKLKKIKNVWTKLSMLYDISVKRNVVRVMLDYVKNKSKII